MKPVLLLSTPDSMSNHSQADCSYSMVGWAGITWAPACHLGYSYKLTSFHISGSCSICWSLLWWAV
jgi:hypothetical protein